MAITTRTKKGLASHPCAMPGDEVEAVLAHPFMVGVGVLLVWVVLRLGFARRGSCALEPPGGCGDAW